jgi:hypothetical protein
MAVKELIMGFTTYQNVANPHATIHRDGCNQIRKRGGEHAYGQGWYDHHESYEQAQTHAQQTGLPVRDCSFCRLR